MARFSKTEFDARTIQLLAHKYRYYVRDAPTVSDAEYDAMEREWEAYGRGMGLDMHRYANWVGFDRRHPLAEKAVGVVRLLDRVAR